MLQKKYLSLILGTGVALLSACSTTQQSEPAPVMAPPVQTLPPVESLPPAQTIPAAPALSQQEQYLLSQSPNAYTIQVLGAQSMQTISNFVSRNAGYNFMQIQSSLNGQPWYVLFYGVYNTQNEAKRALSGLPSAIRQNSPWVRQLSGVQTQINSGRVR